MSRIIVTIFLLGTLMVMVSCGKKADSGNSGIDMSEASVELNGTSVELAGVSFTPPGIWTDFGPSGMRKASYAYGPLEGDTDSATVTVFYFGPTMGGSVEANLDRWIMQMAMTDGSDPHQAASNEIIELSGMKAHLLKIKGTFNASTGGMMGGSTPKEGYVMLGAVMEGPEGNVFFKLTGPEKTATEMSTQMLTMLGDVKKL